ncbi:type II toxin-antitoxin system Phd/YefM family antitoxin [Ornithinimicrobium panacihumi]|uniref:type II toxin-antitoxin system Phd/YefM family antitoxin n=1 Tax=Ornithinimicrobium panacihumi TaxID=2008449 RepID=UPI003F8AB98A
MESIPHRELRNNSSRILARVAAGESFEVTNHGVPAAIISPPTPARVLDQILAAGGGKPAGTRADLTALTRVESADSVGEILADIRGAY